MAQIYWPFDPSTITEGYGYAPWRGGIHDGIDFGVKAGTELRATVDGKIRNNDAGARDGAGVDITAPDGTVTRHWHVSKFLLPNGSTVKAGDVIALSGGIPGTWGAGNTTGAHLHWGVKIGGSWIDPATQSPIMFGTTPDVPTVRKKVNKMLICHTMDGRTPEQGPEYLIFGTDFYQGFGGEGKYFESQIGGQSMPVSRSFMDSVRAFIDAGRK